MAVRIPQTATHRVTLLKWANPPHTKCISETCKRLWNDTICCAAVTCSDCVVVTKNLKVSEYLGPRTQTYILSEVIPAGRSYPSVSWNHISGNTEIFITTECNDAHHQAFSRRWWPTPENKILLLRSQSVIYIKYQTKRLHLDNGFVYIHVHNNRTTVKTGAMSKLTTLNDCIKWQFNIIMMFLVA